jgi:anaerobic selenocysteine-containing dehydrogenase
MGLTRRQLLKRSSIGLGAVLFAGCAIPEREMVAQSPGRIPEDLVEGFDAHYATLCRVCDNPDGILVRVMEGRAKKIEGNPDYPINLGKHSAKCEAGLQALYHPDRIRTPLIRDSRGGEVRPATWDEALDTVVSRFKAAQSQPKGMVLLTSPLRGHLGLVASRFAGAYGGRHFALDTLEETVLQQSVKTVFGQSRIPHFDIENAKYVMSFGSDFLGSWLSPVHYSRQYGEFRQGESRGKTGRGTLVQVEPRFSLTAANADTWIAVRPGYEGALALSIASVIIRERLVDEASVGRFQRLISSETLAKYSEDGSEAAKTGISAERIKGLAHEFVANSPSLSLGGGSAGAHTNGLFNLTAVYALNILVDNVGKAGGIIFNPGSPIPGVPDIRKPSTLAEWKQLAEDMRGGAVQLALVRGANPVYGLPSELRFAEAMDKVPFIVSVASFYDETTAKADVVIPEHIYLEDWGDDIPDPGPGFQTVGFQQPVVMPFGSQGGTAMVPVGTSRGFGDVLLNLAQDVGGPLQNAFKDWRSFDDVIRQGARRLYEDKHGALPLDVGTMTASNFETFWVGVIQRGGWWDRKAIATNKREAHGPFPVARDPEFRGDPDEFPMFLIPFPSHSLGDGTGSHLPWLQATPDPLVTAVWQTWVEVNPLTAKELGLREGDVVRVESPVSTIEALVYPHPATAPDVVSIPMGQGHKGYGRYAQDRGANVLDLLGSEEDKDTKAFAWSATRVRLVKTGRRSRVPKAEGMVAAIQIDHAPVVQVTRG